MRVGFPPRGGMCRSVHGLLIVTVIALSSACCSKPCPVPDDLGPQKIVIHHAETAFEVHFDLGVAEERQALEAFLEKSRLAVSKPDLVRSWSEVPFLQQKEADFLERRIFRKVEADADWHAVGGEREKQVWVEGIRNALSSVLTGGQ